MKGKLPLLLFLAMLPLLAKGQKQTPPPQNEKHLKFALQIGFVNNYHPVEDAALINFKPLLSSLYTTLYRMDDKLKPYPYLIKKYRQTDRKVVFFLKKGLKFSDGKAITASDVVWSIENCLKYRLNPNPLYRLIEGGEELYSGKCTNCTGIKVLTPTSFQINFKYKRVEFPYYFTSSNLAILPQGWTREKKVFSGPYILEKVEKKSDHVVVWLRKNKFYPGKKAKLESVAFCFYTSRTDLDRAIARGEPDLFLYNFYFNIPKSDFKYHYFKTPLAGHFLFLLNPSKGIFKNKKYRTFLKNYLLQIDFTKRENWDFATRARRILPYGLTGYFLFQPFQKEDLSPLIPKQKINVRSFYFDSGIRRSLLPYLKENLKKYNINLELNVEPWTTLSPRLRNGDFDLTAFYYMADIPNSYYFYENLMNLSGDLNPMGYQNPRAIQLLNKYRDETDELKRLKILAQLEEIARDEAYVIPILNYMCLLGYKEKVKNVTIDAYLTLPFEEFDIETRN